MAEKYSLRHSRLLLKHRMENLSVLWELVVISLPENMLSGYCWKQK
jgi:hypothetical protein